MEFFRFVSFRLTVLQQSAVTSSSNSQWGGQEGYKALTNCPYGKNKRWNLLKHTRKYSQYKEEKKKNKKKHKVVKYILIYVYTATSHASISTFCKNCSPYSITERRIPELIPVLGSQPAGDVNHKPVGRLPLLSARPAVTPAILKRAATNFAAWWTEAQYTANVGSADMTMVSYSITNCASVFASNFPSYLSCFAVANFTFLIHRYFWNS